ncbi:MAG: flagellar basal body rod protein FlgC [Clostridia bacterium]|jgi:flagellar basal-body rod protein FlgC|nr:flagellar basal body rod protein FlgC [Clostridia bacterium]
MSFMSSLDVSSSGLYAERLRMDVISENIAKANVTRTADGTPYKKKSVLFAEDKSGNFGNILNGKLDELNGVKVDGIVEDKNFKKVYDPKHPDADDDGYVLMPNVDVLEEMVNMMTASRAYEANITAMNATKSMAMKALNIGK